MTERSAPAADDEGIHPAAERNTPEPEAVRKATMTLATRLALAMILLVAAAVSAAGWLSYHALEQALLPRVLDRIEGHSRLLATELESYVNGARIQIATFRTGVAVRGMVSAHFN